MGACPKRIYVAIQYWSVASEIEFDWDDENRKHLAAHKVAPAEFEQLLNNDPLDLDFGADEGEAAGADNLIQKDGGAGGGITNSRSGFGVGPKAD